MAAGAVAWGSVADRIGRKKAFSTTLLVFAVFSVLAAFSPTYGAFLLLRFLAGVGLGGCIPVDYALISEFSPRRYRGRILTALDLWWPIGGTLCGLASTVMLDLGGNWRWMLGAMALPALLLFWVRRGVPESPIYLTAKGREAEARTVIDGLVARTGTPAEPYAVPAPPQQEASSKRGLTETFAQLGRVWTFNPRITSVAWALFVTIMLVYYAALSWMPSILAAEGYSNTAAFTGTTLMSAVGIAGVAASAWLVDVIGRKWLIGVSAPLASAALVLFALLLGTPTAAMVALGVFGFTIQLTIPVLYAYVAELYPTSMRATGFGSASAASRVATGFAPLLFGTLMWPVLGLPLTFTVLGAAAALAVGWMAVAAPETKGRELDHMGADPAPATAEHRPAGPAAEPARHAN
ncbi:MFS transporter [Streptomyces sp. NBC_01023]